MPDDLGVRGEPCAYPARAWWGDRLVGETSAAVVVEEAGDVALYFPLSDVRLECFRDEGRELSSPAKGPARLWSVAASADDHPASTGRDWQDPAPGPLDGRDVLRAFTDPPEALAWLEGLATFDHDRVRVELVDGVPSGGERDVTVKRFPAWGDTGHLIDILDVRQLDGGAFVSVARTSPRRPVVEGSQMLGQAIVAAGRRAPGRRVVSGHMVFLRAADASQPLRFEVEDLGAGRTFTTVAVQVSQAGRRCASGILMLDVTAPDVIRHSSPPAGVAGPYESEPLDMSVMGRDVRVVGGAYTDDPLAPVGPPEIDAWVRFRDVPDDPPLHDGLLAQFTGHMSIAAALRAHEGVGQREAHRTLSTAINAIGISLHAPVRADQWMLYHHESTFAGDGMTHSQCQVRDEDGSLLASFTVDAMVRKFAGGSEAVDDRRAL